MQKEKEEAMRKAEKEREALQNAHAKELEERMNELNDTANDEEKNLLLNQFNKDHEKAVAEMEKDRDKNSTGLRRRWPPLRRP